MIESFILGGEAVFMKKSSEQKILGFFMLFLTAFGGLPLLHKVWVWTI